MSAHSIDQGARTALLRSLLFVPGDSERKQSKAAASGADALILDLEDSVAQSQLPAARSRVQEFLRARSSTAQQLWVRVNAPGSGQLAADVDAVVAGRPDGLMLPKVGCAEVMEIARHVTQAESRAGIAAGSIKLIIIATETPRALLTLGDYLDTEHPRLVGMIWGAEDLSAALGATAKVDEAGEWTFTFRLARSMCLLTAAAIGVQPIDGVHPAFRDLDGLRRSAVQARKDGFLGKLAIHPDQVGPINAAFTPTAAEVEHARRVVELFAQTPGVGVASLDGQMLDKPHLVLAQRVLELAARSAATN